MMIIIKILIKITIIAMIMIHLSAVFVISSLVD